MNNSSEKYSNIRKSLPKWLKNFGVFLLVFVIISLIGMLPEIGFLRSYFGGNISQMALERTPSSILWEKPIKVPGKFNDIANNYDATISPDGTFAIISHQFAEGNYDLFISYKNGVKWTNPAPIESINSKFDDQNPVVSEDGKILFFSSNRPNGKGGFDIWSSVLTKDKKWSSPYLLGGDVNTEFDEVFPEIAPAQNALFFSSNRPHSKELGDSQTTTAKKPGNYNIYRSIRIPENNEIVSSGPPAFGFVENVEELNSPKNQGKVAVSEDGNLIYLSSDRPGGCGGYDIYISAFKDGKYINPINFKAPINTEYDEISPSMRMGTFKIQFSSNRNSRSFKDFHIYESQSQQVFSVINSEVIWLMLGIVALLITIFLLLKYFFSNTNLSLLAKCFLISIIIHLIILLIMSSLYLRDQIVEEYSDEGELSIGISNLAKENIAASLKEGVVSLPKQSSQSFSSKGENISSKTQLNQLASATTEPKDYQSGESTSSSPESIATLDQTMEDSSPSSGGGSMSIDSVSLDNSLKFTMEQPSKVRGRGENQSLNGDGAQDGIGSGGNGNGKTSGNRTFSDKSPSAGILGGSNIPGIGSLNTASIKGDKDSQSSGKAESSSGAVSGFPNGMLNSVGNGSNGEDIAQEEGGNDSIGTIIGALGDGGKDKTSSGGSKLGMPTLAQSSGKGKAGRSDVPGLDYLSSDKGVTSRALSFPMHYRSTKTQTRDLTRELNLLPREDMPLSTFVGTYFFTKKYYLISVNGIIYRNTTQFTLPANIEMEVSDQYLLKDSNKKE